MGGVENARGYKKDTTGDQIYVIRQLVNLKYRPSTSIAQHLNDLTNIVNQMVNLNMTLDEEIRTLFLLNSMPET